MSYNLEIALRKYIAAFNGNNNIFPAAFKALFDNIFQKDFTFVSRAGKTLTREEVYEREVQKFTSGAKMTLIHFRRIGLGCVDVKLGLECEEQVSSFHAVLTVSRHSGKVVSSKEIDESPERKIFLPRQFGEAKCRHFAYKWQEYASPTNTYLPAV